MITLYGAFEFTALAAALGLATHYTLTRIGPLRRSAAKGACGSSGGCGGCGGGSNGCSTPSTPTLQRITLRPKPPTQTQD